MIRRTTASSNWQRIWKERLKYGSPTSSYLVAQPSRRRNLGRGRNYTMGRNWVYYTNRKDGGPYERIRTNSSKNWSGMDMLNDGKREELVRQTEEGIQYINKRLDEMENSQHMQYIADARTKGASGQELDEMLTHLEAGNKGLASDVLKQVEARQPTGDSTPDLNPNAALQTPEPDTILIPWDPDRQNLMQYENMTVAQLIASDAPHKVKQARIKASYDRLQEEANQTVAAEKAAKVSQREAKYGEDAAKHKDADAAWKAAGSPPSGELYAAARAALDAKWNLRG